MYQKIMRFLLEAEDLHVKGQVTGAQGDAGEDQLDNTIDESEEEREICSLCWASKGGSTIAVGYITGDILLWDMTSRSSRQDKQSDVSSNVVKLQLASGSRRLSVIVLHWSAGSAMDAEGISLYMVVMIWDLKKFSRFLAWN
uniref:Uncharacterized protein n=1 Tax=Arundo donax TaxID=35708 RepID=A0A0A9CG30_ARUDO